MEIQPLPVVPAAGVSPAPLGNRRAQESPSPPAGSNSAVERADESEQGGALSAGEAGAAQLRDAVDKVNKFVQMMATDLRFTVDEESGARVVRVIDMATKDVIRQFPSEEMLAIARGLDRLQGLLVKQTA